MPPPTISAMCPTGPPRDAEQAAPTSWLWPSPTSTIPGTARSLRQQARILPGHGYQPVILVGESWRRLLLSGGADGVILGSVPAEARRRRPRDDG